MHEDNRATNEQVDSHVTNSATEPLEEGFHRMEINGLMSAMIRRE